MALDCDGRWVLGRGLGEKGQDGKEAKDFVDDGRDEAFFEKGVMGAVGCFLQGAIGEVGVDCGLHGDLYAGIEREEEDCDGEGVGVGFVAGEEEGEDVTSDGGRW